MKVKKVSASTFFSRAKVKDKSIIIDYDDGRVCGRE
jgi:hypothetical protein